MHKAKVFGGALLASVIAAVSLPASAAPPEWGVPLPVPQIPGYSFPAAESTLLGWIDNNNTGSIYLHGWGLWTALTSASGRTAYGIANAPVYLTWATREDLVLASKGNALAGTTARSHKLHLGEVTQLRKFGIHSIQPRAALSLKATSGIVPDTDTLETVTYDPVAGQQIYNGGLFKLATIKKVYDSKQPEIPAFPSNAVVVKPVYKLVSSSKLYQGRYYVIAAWPGTPPVTPQIQANGFPETAWNAGCIYVDTQNQGASTASAVDPACSGPTAATTYGLGDFVHFTVTAENVALFDFDNKLKVLPGDTLLLVAMHVSTREITAWTWQTFFWTPNPANPPLPSSSAIGAAIPSQLTGAPAHYAASFAYAMVSPNQPVSGGNSAGSPVVGYNPYLEAGFPMSQFGISRPIYPANGGPSWTGTVGVQTNCMTCHALASVAFASKTALPQYGTDFYIGRDDPAFSGTVQTEFLWSIADVVAGQQQNLKAGSAKKSAQ